ncbi:MAG: hypothetical protein LJE68_10790 [Rhodobacter sp.]|nr:hypothetical protein [Rhodobacter sp.]
MSDYDLRQPDQRRDGAHHYHDESSNVGLWVLGTGIVLVVIVALFMLGGTPSTDGGLVDDGSAMPAAGGAESAPATPTPATE